jgi:uncharacterized membrane protein
MAVKKGRTSSTSSYRRVGYALLISNSVSLLLSALRSVESQTDRYWFLTWNLILAWLPLAFVWWLVTRLRKTAWWSWPNIGLTLLWLGFLPNSFYLMSDLIHLHETGEVSLLYDIVMFMSFIFNGLVAGFMSLFLVHRELLKRVAYEKAHGLIILIILACSFAIYLGRSLRWNSWDILINPAGLLFDVSDRVVNPAAHPQTFVTTVTFFVLLLSVYLVIWELVRALRTDNR